MSRRSGITKVEVLVVALILFILAGLLLPWTVQVRDGDSARSRSMNNLKQIALACHNYNDAYQGKLPPLTDVGNGAPTGGGLQSLFFNILPYIEQDNVYKLYQHSTATYAEAASNIIKTYISWADSTATDGTTTDVLLTGSGPDVPAAPILAKYATTSYAANGLVFGSNTAGLPRTFKDGTSNTIMFVERHQVCKPADGPPVYNLWAYGMYGPSTPAFALLTPDKPAGLASTDMIAPVTPLPEKFTKASVPVRVGSVGAPVVEPPKSAPFQTVPRNGGCDPRVPQSTRQAGILTAMADGSVRTTSPTVSQWTFWAACTPDGNESLGPDW
jgi:type II secretory pathway pseudopilin PulG